MKTILEGLFIVAVVLVGEYIEGGFLEAAQPSVSFFPKVISDWDVPIFLWINNGLANVYLGWLFSVLTRLGSTGITLIACALLYFSGRRKEGTVLFVSVALVTLIVLALKLVVPRPRPFTAIPSTIVFGRDSGSSFPSGHTMRIFASAYIFSKFWPRFRIPFYLIASLVGFSRIYLGQHYPSDVLAGILMGLAVGYLTIHYHRTVIETFSRFIASISGRASRISQSCSFSPAA